VPYDTHIQLGGKDELHADNNLLTSSVVGIKLLSLLVVIITDFLGQY